MNKVSSKSFRNEKNTPESQNVFLFFPTKFNEFDRKTGFHQIFLSTVSLHGKISLRLRIKLCVSLSV